jgi:hypothetical protein
MSEQLPPRPDPIRTKCRFRTRAGAPCLNWAYAGTPDFGCPMHSQAPAILEMRRKASVAGGHGRSNLRRAAKIVAAGPYRGLADILQRAAQEVYDGQLDPQRGHALANLARGIVVVADQATVSDRLAELEEEIARIKSGEIIGETFSRPPLVTPGG